MKTALFSPCRLSGNDTYDSPRFERNVRYLNWYFDIQEDIGFDHVFLADNASPPELIEKLKGQFPDKPISMLCYQQQLYRCHSFLNYPFWWRALYGMRDVMDLGYDKILFIDSDSFVLKRSMANWIRDQKSGWVAMYAPTQFVPECNLQVLCKDAFWLFKEFARVPYMAHNGKMAEVSLPFSAVEKGFTGDRYGEKDLPQTEWMDYYCQATHRVDLAYDRQAISEIPAQSGSPSVPG